MVVLTSTILCAFVLLLLTLDTLKKIPLQTKESNLSSAALRGKDLWIANNCMGCHTLFGEGAYYAPELTKVYKRRGPEFIKMVINDAQKMYPGQRKMRKYHFTEQELNAFVEFFKWVGEVDTNGFPPNPPLKLSTGPNP